VTRKLLVLSVVLLLSACQSPFLIFPGEALEGQLTYTDSFAFADRYKLLQLEVGNPAYSVFLRTTLIDGELYVDAAPSRQWAKLLRVSPQVKIKLGDALFAATAIVVTDPSIVGQFLSNRTIYLMQPTTRASTDVTH